MSSQPQPVPQWRHAAELGPVTAITVFAAGAGLSLVRVPLLVVVVVAAVAFLAACLAAVVLSRSWPGAVWLGAAACAGCGWLAYATVRGPWSWPALTGMILPVVLLTLLWPALHGWETAREEAERRRRSEAHVQQEGRRWSELLSRVGARGVRYGGQEPTRCGYDVRLRLPESGRLTFTALARRTEQLEVAARMRRGSLRFEQPPGPAHEVLLHVIERDVLAETLPLPPEVRRRSINDPLSLGMHEDGTVAEVTLREVATLIVGLRGSGKSNLLNVLIAQLARCVDVLIWVIDLKGGRMARPWLEPWLAGQTPRPVVDWLATTREEAALMFEAALRGIAARSNSGSGGEKIIPSAGQPAVIIVVDEMAIVLGQNTGGPRTSMDGVTNASLAKLAKQSTILGRSEAIDGVYATQRGTVTMTGDGDLKSQCGVRIGLGVATEADARLVIADDAQIAGELARLQHPGTGIMQVKDGRAVPLKFFRIEHGDIAPIAITTGGIRPAPDPVLAAALGVPYAERWTHRAGYLAPPSRSPAAVVAAPAGAGQPAVADDEASPARRRMREFVGRGPHGATPKMIMSLLESEGTGVARQTVQRWLAEDESAGLLEHGTFGRWHAKTPATAEVK